MLALSRIILFTMVVAAAVSRQVWAQESLPDKPEPAAEPSQTERIVEGRPRLYTFKRVAHPLTWFEAALEPPFRSADSGWIHRMMVRKPAEKESGVRFGVGSAGTSSGLGPQVTFFHKNFLGRGIDVELPLLYTFSRYQVYRFQASVPIASESFVDRLSFDLATGYSSRARDDFFGLGNDSDRENERQLRTITREASAGFTAKLNDAWTAGLHGVYRTVGITKPTFGHSAQEFFDSSSTPGLFGAALESAVFSLGRDTREREDNAFKGGSDQFEVSFNRSAGGREFEYWRYRLDSEHFFPLTSDGRKVIAARALVDTNQPTSGSRVPFFDMPVLGSSGTLRGFENFRFRDKSAAAFTLEYRYRIWPSLDWGLFVDEGQVAPQLGDMALNRFHTGYGVRLFVWPKPNMPISFDYGRSRETWRFYVNINTRF
jgi:outer membrane protein assembly factor BamA